MNDINHVTIIGRLTRDIASDERAFAYLPNGTARANVSIAVNRSRKNGDQWVDEVSYFDVTIWGKTAENLKPYLTKGKQIAVEGSLRQDRWQQDGQNKSRVVIVADNVQLLGGRSDNGGDNGFSQGNGFNQNNGFNQQPSGGFAPKFQPRTAAPGSNAPMDDIPYQDTGSFPEDIPF